MSQALHWISFCSSYSILNASSRRGSVSELGCKWGYEGFRNSVIWIRTEIAELEKGFEKSPLPSAGGVVRMIRSYVTWITGLDSCI